MPSMKRTHAILIGAMLSLMAAGAVEEVGSQGVAPRNQTDQRGNSTVPPLAVPLSQPAQQPGDSRAPVPQPGVQPPGGSPVPQPSPQSVSQASSLPAAITTNGERPEAGPGGAPRAGGPRASEPPASGAPNACATNARDDAAVAGPPPDPAFPGVSASKFRRAGVPADAFERPGVSAAQLATLLPGARADACGSSRDFVLAPPPPPRRPMASGADEP